MFAMVVMAIMLFLSFISFAAEVPAEGTLMFLAALVAGGIGAYFKMKEKS